MGIDFSMIFGLMLELFRGSFFGRDDIKNGNFVRMVSGRLFRRVFRRFLALLEDLGGLLGGSMFQIPCQNRSKRNLCEMYSCESIALLGYFWSLS